MSNNSIDGLIEAQARPYKDAARRADARGEHSSAIIFRNIAYQVEHGMLCLSIEQQSQDVQIVESMIEVSR